MTMWKEAPFCFNSAQKLIHRCKVGFRNFIAQKLFRRVFMQSIRSYSLRKVLGNGYRRSSSLIGRDSLIGTLDCPFQLDVISEQFVSRASELCWNNLCTSRSHYDFIKSRLIEIKLLIKLFTEGACGLLYSTSSILYSGR